MTLKNIIDNLEIIEHDDEKKYKYIIYMPYAVRKLPNKNLYRVYNKNTGTIYSKATTKDKADAQLRLLRSVKK